ncbi:MAG: cobalamin B12-binding domain-containing protein [Planctomycetota bacterium]
MSRSLDSVTQALTAWVVDRHAESDPGLAARYGDGWRSAWVADVRARIRALAQSIAVERPALFADSMQWSRAAVLARDGELEDLRASLRCLREVVDQELPAGLADRAGACVDAALAGLDEPEPPEPPAPGRAVLEYLEALLDARGDDAARLALGHADAGMTIPEIYERILRPAQVEIGNMWHRGELGVGDEHYATAATHRVMAQLHARAPRLAPSGRRMAAVAVEGDLHEIGVRMVADHFEMAGWKSFYLGANVPADDVLEVVLVQRPHLVAVSASTALVVRAVGLTVDTIRGSEAAAGVRIVVGGAPFHAVPDLWEAIGADGMAASAAEAVALGDALVPTP